MTFDFSRESNRFSNNKWFESPIANMCFVFSLAHSFALSLLFFVFLIKSIWFTDVLVRSRIIAVNFCKNDPDCHARFTFSHFVVFFLSVRMTDVLYRINLFFSRVSTRGNRRVWVFHFSTHLFVYLLASIFVHNATRNAKQTWMTRAKNAARHFTLRITNHESFT